jgi:class 3 adenylate cyclase
LVVRGNRVEAERRQVTVLFTDMVGFTAFSERAGEEAAFTLMQGLAQLMEDAVREQGGVVQGFTGDGVMAVFGAPVALEDAPLRACRAALAILERLKATSGDIEARHQVRPQLRIGINTGLAVVGQVQGGAGAGVTVLGDTVNVAARLQAMAEPDAVVMSEAMHRLVEGLVEASFAGAHSFKGKAEPQKVYQLRSVRQGATRFKTALGRGLSAYVGRERELDVLEGCLAAARDTLNVVDLMAEPGMGKSRLLHEFRQRIGGENVFVLSGSCSPDGQQTPFLPFIEVVRGSFHVSAAEPEREVLSKLGTGLTVLGLHSAENLGLLLNLLGLDPPEGALAGLDGLLIGLRTRELLQQLVEARCRLSPVAMLIEDLHWIDSASEKVLEGIVASDANLPLLLVDTRRPEYEPAWLDRPMVAKLRLAPLPAGDVRRLVQERLQVEALPASLARLVAEKAEGNALFAEEIVSFLTERGVLRVVAGKVEFDAGTVAAVLPASVQNLLTARVDRLAPQERALLQAAAVIGRRFDPELLATADDSGDIDARLNAMRALDLVYPEGESGVYSFKHALVRDALYQSLLSGPRAALHLKVAQEIERRGGNRLAEVVEILAHHYSQTDRTDKAFTYLAMAGAKSLGVYSLDEVENHLAAALALLHKRPDCASDQQVGDLLVDYTLYLNLLLRLQALPEIVERHMPRLDRLADSHKRVLIQHQYVLALLWTGRYREAEKAQADLSEMADRLHDVRSKAYALASAIHVSTGLAPHPVETFEALSRDVTAASANVNDAYLQYFVRFIVGWEEFHRGRMAKAHEAAQELIAAGRRMNDPRSIGYGMALQAWIALTSADYLGALNFAETSINIARTPHDKELAKGGHMAALVLLQRSESFPLLRAWMDECIANNWHWYLVSFEGLWSVALAVQGRIGESLRWMEQAILKREREGYRTAADWYRMILCDIYLEIIAGKEKPSAKVIARNALTLFVVMFTARRRISSLVEHVRQNPQFDPNGQHIGRCEMIMGLLYKAKKKRALAVQHLIEAKRIISQFGPTPMLARIDAALTELS